MKLLLASASPRRRELLRLITAEFQVTVSDVDETVPETYLPDEVVLALARRKAEAVWQDNPDATVIGADTIVVLDGAILGKPRDQADAAAMLTRLSGRVHEVYTGVFVRSEERWDSFAERAMVEFGVLSPEQIAAYVATGEPMDKAGAYGIQGKGAALVKEIRGDYYTVMGLPVYRLASLLAESYGVGWWV